MDNDRQTKNAASEGTGASPCSPIPGMVFDGKYGGRFIVNTVGKDGEVGGYWVTEATPQGFPADWFISHFTPDSYYKPND